MVDLNWCKCSNYTALQTSSWLRGWPWYTSVVKLCSSPFVLMSSRHYQSAVFVLNEGCKWRYKLWQMPKSTPADDLSQARSRCGVWQSLSSRSQCFPFNWHFRPIKNQIRPFVLVPTLRFSAAAMLFGWVGDSFSHPVHTAEVDYSWTIRTADSLRGWGTLLTLQNTH